MSTLRFGELPIGTRFCFRARRYEKVAANIGRDEERGGNVFHASTVVLVEVALAGEEKRKLAPPSPPAIPREPRSRLPSEREREVIDAGLRMLCPQYQLLPDGWYGTYSEDSDTSKRKKYGTGN